MNNNDDSISLNDLINNLKTKLNDQTSSNDSPCFGNDMELNSIFNKIATNINTTDNENNSTNSNFDISSIIRNLNLDDPRKELLLSLKPFLKKSRQNKIDTYISLLSLSSIFKLSNIFTTESSDNDV